MQLRPRLGAPLLALVLIAAALTTAGTAHAVDAPSGLLASGTEAGDAPIVSWERTPGATGYDVQFSRTPDFSTLIGSTITTTNVSYVPTAALPEEVYWRVRAKDAGGSSSWSSADFERDLPDAPSLRTPPANHRFSAIDDIPVLSWHAVPGATGYDVRIGSDPMFTDPAFYTDRSTKSTYLLHTPSATESAVYWQVTAQFGGGIQGSPSEVRTFTTSGLRPIDAATAHPAFTPESDEYVEDSVFNWDPVPGAVTYELQVDTDTDFDSNLIDKAGITGTSYARPTTLANDQYFWRVRGVDAFGKAAQWSSAPIFTFRRAWPRQPQLEHPIGDATVSDPLYFEWTPIRLASRYTLQLSADPTFNNIHAACTTVHTTYVPTAASDCWPASGGKWFWRVQALDGSSPVSELVHAEVGSFTYDSWSVDPGSFTPTDGYEGAPPTLTWEPLDNAARYRVEITNTDNGQTTTYTTATSAVSPRINLKPRTANAVTYRWNVYPITESGRSGNGLFAGSQPAFTVTSNGYGTSAKPEPISPLSGSFTRFPTLTWQAMEGADTTSSSHPPTYRVHIRQQGAQAWTPLPGTTRQTSYQDFGSTYVNPNTTYQWRVESTGANGTTAAISDTFGTFSIAPLADTTGERMSLRGDASNPGSACQAMLPSTCGAMTETPVLSWDPVPDAGYYNVLVSYDAAHTNRYRTYQVDGTKLRPTVAYHDSQAGTAYFWHVQPCTSGGRCNPIAPAQHAFEKFSDPVVINPVSDEDPTTPGVQVTDDVTFTWQDYYETHPLVESVQAPARIEADKYTVQIATDPLFQQEVETATVDQTQFTSYSNTYPEGPLWWRVQAIDASGNTLPWSDAQAIVKRSPVPALTSPTHGTVDASGAELRWEPLLFAAAYDVEVYRNNDTGANAVNRVVNTSSKLPALALGTPLPRENGPYVWRVRRADAKGRKGAWSPFQRFEVQGAAPTFAAPDHDTIQPPNGAIFQWNPPEAPAPQPSAYRFQRRKVGAASLTENQITSSTAWAPTKTLAEGEWEWRVIALDVDNKELGDTGQTWRRFTVNKGPVAIQPPEISGNVSVGSVLDVKRPVWDLPGVTETYQWYRNSSKIDGAIQLAYTVRQEDVGGKLTLRVTGHKDGYASTDTTSNVLNAEAGTVIENLTAPRIVGTAVVGQTLRVDVGAWSQQSGVRYAYQWFRKGAPIPQATGSSYRLTAADIRQPVHVQVTASRSQYLPGVARSAPVTPPKAKSTTTASIYPTEVKRKTPVTVRVRVQATGIYEPAGSIIIKRGKKKLVQKKLKASHRGYLTIKIAKKKLKKKGNYKLVVHYRGNAQIKASKAKRIVLRVT